jgi:sec-independent protein translocase protein TatC
MTLGEHFREFRRRLFIAAASVAVASVVAGIFYDQVFDFLSEPFNDYKRSNPRSTISLNFGEATSALSNLISLSIFVGVLVSSPIWLYQIWAFHRPGLTRKEKRISLAFLAATIPLFIAGCYLGYLILPQSLAILYGFSPGGDVEHPAGVDVLLLRHPLHPRVRARLPVPRRARRASTSSG